MSNEDQAPALFYCKTEIHMVLDAGLLKTSDLSCVSLHLPSPIRMQ